VTFWVYMLRCSDDSYYVGHTDNLETRLAQHRSGSVPGYTSQRRPVKLIWCEDFGTREDAFQRERQVKGWSRKKKEALAAGAWDALVDLARARPSTSSG